MSGSISFSGLVSGLDIDSIIAKMISIQKKPINQLKAQNIVLDKKNTALSDINTKLLDLLNKVKPLLSSDIFNATKASVTDTSILTATSTAQASAGTHSIIVKQLATNTTRTSSGFAGTSVDPAAAMNSTTFKTIPTSGTFTIAHDTGAGLVTKTFTIDPNSQSLNDVINMINTDADLGAPANGIVASYDAGTDTFKLTNKNAADANSILLGSGSDTSNFLTATNLYTGTVATGPPYSVTSSPHIASIRPDSVITASGANFGTLVTAGTFNINGVAITIDSSTDTLNSVIGKINASSAGVTATYDSTQDKITLTSKSLGNTAITVSDGTSNFASAAKLTTATQVTGKQSIVNVDGADYFRNTLSPSDIINGVTLNLLKVDLATTVTLTVSRDTASASGAINSFVSSFNASLTAIYDKTKAAVFDGTTKKTASGTLSGEFLITGASFDLQNMAISQIPGMSDTLDSLADIGITLTRTPGAAMQLTVDSGALDSALQNNITQVAQLFNADDSTTGAKGIALQLEDYLEPLTSSDSEDGGIQSIISGNTDIKTRNEKRITDLEERLAKEEERLKNQFAALEVTLAKLQQQSSALNYQLSILGAMTGGSKK